jgi:hypothetical protein
MLGRSSSMNANLLLLMSQQQINVSFGVSHLPNEMLPIGIKESTSSLLLATGAQVDGLAYVVCLACFFIYETIDAGKRRWLTFEDGSTVANGRSKFGFSTLLIFHFNNDFWDAAAEESAQQ